MVIISIWLINWTIRCLIFIQIINISYVSTLINNKINNFELQKDLIFNQIINILYLPSLIKNKINNFVLEKIIWRFQVYSLIFNTIKDITNDLETQSSWTTNDNMISTINNSNLEQENLACNNHLESSDLNSAKKTEYLTHQVKHEKAMKIDHGFGFSNCFIQHQLNLTLVLLMRQEVKKCGFKLNQIGINFDIRCRTLKC